MVEPRISFQKLEVFCLVAQLGNVTRAAERLGVAQPVVTRHIRSLEEQLGVRLVARVGRNIALTEAGERVYRWCEEILSRARELDRELAELKDGSVGKAVIAASMTAGSYLLPDLIASYLANHPSALITTQISNPRSAIEAVVTGSCDFALTLLDPKRVEEDVVMEGLWKERLLLIAAIERPTSNKSISPSDLNSMPFVSTQKNLIRREFEDEQLRQLGVVRQNIIVEFGHAEAMKRAVQANLGVGLLLETSVRKELEQGALKEIPVKEMELWIPLFLVYRKRKNFSPLQADLVEFIRSSKPQNMLPY